MLIATFRSSYPSQYLFLLLLALLLWLPAFINPPSVQAETCVVSPLSGFISTLSTTWNMLPVILGFLLLILSGFLINLVMIQSDLISKNSLIPAMIYIFCMSSDPGSLVLNGEMIANVFFLLLLSTAYPLYEESPPLTPYLTVGLFVSLASLFYFPAVFVIVFIYFILWIYRSFTWREWLIPLIGLIVPYLYLFTYYFWVEETREAIFCYQRFFTGLPRSLPMPDTDQLVVSGLMVLFLLIPALLRMLTGLSSYNISIRKKLSASLWFFIITLAIGLLVGNLLHFSLIWIPASILMAHHIDLLRRKWWNELIIILIFAGLVAHNYIYS